MSRYTVGTTDDKFFRFIVIDGEDGSYMPVGHGPVYAHEIAEAFNRPFGSMWVPGNYTWYLNGMVYRDVEYEDEDEYDEDEYDEDEDEYEDDL